MKKRNLCIAILYGAITVCGLCACDDETPSTQVGSASVWSKEGHVKVFADKEYDESFRRELAVNIGACKNEYEATQIVLTGEAGVSTYDLQLSDLTSAAGDTFSKENITLYNEKYINIDSSAYSNTYGLGWYPDALLPLETAKAYGENKVKAGENQAIYVEAYIPTDTKAGVYSGNFTLTVNGESTSVPVSLTVYDYTVSQYNHLASIFSWHQERLVVGEKGNTEALRQNYLDTFMEYRISAPVSIDNSIESWVDNFRIYCNPEKTPNTSVMGTISITVNRSGSGINKADFRTRLAVAAAASLVDGIDYMQYLDTRCGFIDEPHLNGTHDLANTVMASYNEARNGFAQDLLSGAAKAEVKAALSTVGESMTDDEFDAAYENMKESLSTSTAGILNVVTSTKDPRFTSDVESFCVTRQGVISAKDREYYKDLEKDQWWYFCSGGNDMFSYAIDAQLLESRMVGWASYDYEFVGDVFWETVLYTSIEWDNTVRINVEKAIDPYAEAYRSGGYPGDGFLVYPGKQYGLSSPVTSIRLHAIRDGREEYEMLYDLEQKYAQAGYSPRSVLNVLFKDLYKDIELTDVADDVFLEQRETLIKLCMLANKGVFLTDFEEIGAQATLTTATTGSVHVSKVSGGGTVSLTGTTNEITVELTDGDTFTLNLGGKRSVIKECTAADVSVVADAEVSANTVDGVTGAKITLKPSVLGSTVNIAVDSSSITKNDSSLFIRIYNPNEKKAYVSVFLEGSGGVGLAGDGVLYHGWNTIQINNLAGVNWKNVKKLQNVQLMFTVGDGENVADYDGFTVTQLTVEE